MHENAKPMATLKHFSARTEAQFKSPHFTVSFSPSPPFTEDTNYLVLAPRVNAVVRSVLRLIMRLYSRCNLTPNLK